MKTWIFDEQALDAAIVVWVENQIASGHPMAVANAAFVGRAIKNMLETSPKLFKESESVEPLPTKIAPSSTLETDATLSVTTRLEHERAQSPQHGRFSIEDMKKAWYGTD